MVSPFPGMDPYLEHPAVWPDVHSRLANAIGELLGGAVGERYWVGIERRVYIEFEDVSGSRVIVPDVTVVGTAPERARGPRAPTAAPLVLEAPQLSPVEVRETYLVVRELPSRKVVTLIEILSPSNKREGVGRAEYLLKRAEVLRTQTHLVELDLLRDGQRLPVVGQLPAVDYFAFVHRGKHRPKVEVYGWTVRDGFPRVPIPLLPDDPDAALDLEEALKLAYTRGRYERVIDYEAPANPPLEPADAAWAAERTRTV